MGKPLAGLIEQVAASLSDADAASADPKRPNKLFQKDIAYTLES